MNQSDAGEIWFCRCPECQEHGLRSDVRVCPFCGTECPYPAPEHRATRILEAILSFKPGNTDEDLAAFATLGDSLVERVISDAPNATYRNAAKRYAVELRSIVFNLRSIALASRR
jgi:hypothetical protein